MSGRGVTGRGVWGAVQGLAAVPVGLLQCLTICRQRRPDLAIGIGGYTSPPLVLAAFLLGIKRAILEPNVHPGMANRVLSPFVDLIFVSLAEITACGKPAILIPFPHAIHGHQERNARILEQAGAATVILDAGLTGEALAAAITALLANPGRLGEMGRCSKGLGRADSAERVVMACRALLGAGGASAGPPPGGVGAGGASAGPPPGGM